MNKQKTPRVASLLSFILPGAGLAYLGKPGWGVLNLGIVWVVLGVAGTVLSDDDFGKYIGFVAAGCSAGSAILIFLGCMKLWPNVVRPLLTFPTRNETTCGPSKARTE